MIAGVTHLQHRHLDCTSILSLSSPSLSPFHPNPFLLKGIFDHVVVGSSCQVWNRKEASAQKKWSNKKSLRADGLVTRCSGSPSSSDTVDKSSAQAKAPFGYTRKDVILIGVGVTAFGVGLKSGLEYFGVDPLQAGNVVQLVIVLGMTVGWISTYMFRVASKDMTYAKQLRDYESKVMEKRLEGLTEAELQVLLEQVEEEKRLANSEQVN